MKRPLIAALSLLFLCTPRSSAQDDPRALVEWLRVAAIESRLSYQFDETPKARLFTDTVPDGRTLMQFIADRLGTSAGGAPNAPAVPNNWALLDEASSLCLAEAEKLKALAAAAAGTAAEEKYNQGRKLFLEGAGRLLGFYKVAADDLFEDNVEALGEEASELADWFLPGNIELKEIAGGGRLNTQTGEFSGRLSGEVGLPRFDANLVVPNLSFDSKGNLDLTAYGMASFPPAPGDSVTITIPERRPLHLHLGDDGSFRADGSAQLQFAGGNKIEAYLDIDDPAYEFGFAFSGGLTLELAKEVTLLRPVVDFEAAEPLALDALAGFGQFFGSLGAGMEVFLGEAPNLPSLSDLDVGVAPEFEAPQTTVPFDVWDAWVVGLANEHVRPALNGNIDGTLQPVRDVLSKLREDIAMARDQTGADLAQMKRLRRIAELNGQIKRTLDDAAAITLLGGDAPNFQEQTLAAANEAVVLATEYLQNTPADADFKTGFSAVRLLLQTEATAALSGADSGLDLGLTFLKLDQWEGSLYSQFGFNLNGSVADPQKVAELGRDDLHALAIAAFELEAMRALLGAGGLNPAPSFLRHEFVRVRDAYNAAVAADDLENRAVHAVLLLDLAVVHETIGFTANNAEQQSLFLAIQDTFEAIANRGSGGATGEKLATSFLEAARKNVKGRNDRVLRRKAEIFGETRKKPEFSRTLDFSFYDYSFFQKLHTSAAALDQAGLLDAAAQGRVDANITSFLSFYREAQVATYSDASLVTQNFQGAYDTLTNLLDAIAFIEDRFPGKAGLLGEFETSWEALHLTWTPIAEAQKAHWYLAAYLREISSAAGRYGDGVSAAVESSFTIAGSEAGAGLQRVVDALAGLLDTVELEEFQFSLPGDVEVQRLFGNLAFNRITGEWAVGFGGKVAFPDVNANFELQSATLASNGDFSLAILTDGPVPFGLLDAASLDIANAFDMSGNLLTPVINNANASGVFTVTPDVGPASEYNISLNYDFLDPDHQFRVTANFTDPTELFTPEIVLFSGGFGFGLESNANGQPTQLGADVALNAGVLLRPEAADTPLAELTPDDFYLHLDGEGGLDFSADDQTISLSVAAGTTLRLPPDIFTKKSDDSDATVVLATDLCVQYAIETGEVSFCDVNGAPVAIQFNDIVLAVPGLDELEADIHQATLLVSGSDLPVLTNLDATLSIPLPGDSPALVGISEGEFRLDGLPSGSITLLSDVTLFEAEGFSFSLLGNGSGVCPQPTQLDITLVEHGPFAGQPRVALNGALRFTVPPTVLQADSAGGPTTISATACGAGFVLEPGQDPRFTLDSLTIDGGGDDFLFTGQGGLRIGNPRLGLDNISQLWSPDASGVFSVSLTGQLAIDGIGGFGLNDAVFRFPRGGLPEFSLAGVDFRIGSGMGLDISFPSRAGIVHDQGETFLEFGVIDIDFTEDSPIQFIGELNFTDDGENRRLSLSEFNFDELINALSLDPGDGVGVKIYDYLTAIWYGGEFTDAGIRDASFSLSSEELPLPDTQLTIPILSFRPGEPARFAFYGDFELKDETATPAKVRVPPNRPVWLEVSPQSLRLGGRVEVMMEGGTTFAGELLLDDPFYQIKIEADGVTFPLAAGLADLLPANPATCLPANDDHAQLDVAAICLKSYAEAYANFSATVAGAAVTGADPDAAPPEEPPGPFNSALSALEAWSWSALAPTAQAMPLSNLVEFFNFTCDASAGTRDAETVTRYLLALKRARQAIQDGALEGTQAEKDALATAIADAQTALIARTNSPEAVASLKSLEQTLKMILEIEAISAQLGEELEESLLETHVPKLIERATSAHLASLGVEENIFTPENNPIINAMNRFVAFGVLRDLLQLSANAALLGADEAITGPMLEAQTQLAHRFYTLNEAALDKARDEEDIRSFQYAMEDLLELESFRALGIFNDHPSLTMMPGIPELASYAQELSNMFLADLDRTYGDRTYRNQLITLQGLLTILEEMPDGVTFSALPFENALTRMDQALDEAVTTIVLNERCSELALMIEAGLVHSRLMARFELPLAYDWDGSDGYLETMVARLATIAGQKKCWSQLHQAALLLIKESEHPSLQPGPGRSGNLPRRRAYLENAVTLLNAARSVARACWDDEENRREANPALNIADMILPGDIHLHKVAGSASYNRRTGEFKGALSGEMSLPKFDSTLTLNNASFSSGGSFDLNAYGHMTLPPGGDYATLTIPERRPLHVSFRAPNDFSLTGGATLQMSNGLEFEAHLTIDDPEYAFGASMKGVRFDLADQMTVFVPEFPNNAEVFPEVSGRILGRYFHSLGGTLETLVPLSELNALEIGDPGTPSEFVAPTLDDPLQPLELWINSALKDIEQGVNNVYTDSTEALREQLRLIALDLKELTAEVKNLDAIATRNRALHRATKLLQRMADETLLGGDPGHEQWAELRLAVDEALAAARCLMDVPGNQSNLWRANRTAKAVLDAAAADAVIGGNDPILTELTLFYQIVLDSQFTTYGFDPDGNQTNPAAVAGLDREELTELVKAFLDTLATFVELGGNDKEDAVFSVVETLLFTQRDLIVRKLREIGENDFGEHLKLAKAYLSVPSTAALGFDYADEGELISGGRGPISEADDIQRAMDEIEAALEKQMRVERSLAANPSERFLRDLLAAVEQSGRDLRQDIKIYLNRQVERRANQLEEFISQDWPAGRIRDGLGALEDLLDVLAWLESQDAPELPHFQDVVLPDLTVKFTAAAEAQKAWWLLSRYTEMLYDASLEKIGGDVTILASAFESAASDSLRASKRLADALTLLLPSARPTEISLPGDLLIESAYGEIFYNRETQFLQGKLGGRVSFPEANTYFEIVQLTVANDGTFSIDLTTGGEIPFGDSTQVNFNVPVLSGSGDLEGNFSFNGAGSLSFLDPADPENATTVSATVGYSTDTGVIDFTGGVNNLQILEDLVIINGNLAATISTTSPNGAITIGGGPGGTTVGLLAREKPIPSSPPTAQDFFLTLGIEPTTFTYSPTDLSVMFTGGNITLPPDIFSKTTNGELNSDPATIALAGNLCINYNFEDSELSFCDDLGQPFTLAFDDIGFEIPGLPGSLVAIDDTLLQLSGTEFPTLVNLAATFSFPMPGTDYNDAGSNRTLQFDLDVNDWRLDGLPTNAAITLGLPVRVLDFDGFDLDILAGSNITFSYDQENNQMQFELAGGMRGAFDPNLVWDAGEGAGAAISGTGSFSWIVGELPSFAIDTVSLEGNFRLGGESGIGIKGRSTNLDTTFAVIELIDLQNIFRRTTDHPFSIRVDGAMDIANFVEFGLESTAFIWDGTIDGVQAAPNNLIPRFEPGGFYGAAGEEAIELAGEFLPLYPTLLGLRFRNSSLPLFPENGEMGLFDITNMIAIVSGVVSLPNGAAIEAGSPGFSGSVDLLEIGFIWNNDLNFYVPDLENLNLNALCIQLNNLDIPPLGGISGGICIGNLSALPNNPQDLYFAGNVGAKIKEIGASVLFAAKPTEFIGACFELNAGPAGIPLDGGTLGGILLTGGRGGINFKNQFSDPCDFASYISTGDNVPSREDREGNPEEPPAQVIPADFAGGPMTCVSAPFPPPSVNPLCEEFPADSGRFIFKGTQLTEANLNSLGITRASVGGKSVQQVIDQFVDGTISAVEDELQNAVLAATDAGTPLEAVEFFINLADGLLESFDDAATSVLLQAVQSGLKVDPNQEIYDILVAKAGEGIPCFDTTLLVGGTLSHSTISTVLSGSGNVTLSTTGTAVFDGSINLIGIPVATGTLALSLTNDQGMIDPAFGGLANVALGPLDLAELSVAISCQGCFTATANEFANLLACQGAALGPAATEFAYEMLETTLGRSFDRSTSLADHWITLDTQEQLAYLSSFFNYMQLVVNGDPLPIALDPAALGNFRDCFIDFIIALFPQVNPFICLSGEVGPKLFGFPLTGGADTLFGASIVYGRVEDNGQQFQELIASTKFSPTFLLTAAILGSGAGSIPAVDEASMGYSLRIPAFEEDTVELLLTDPAQFAQDQFTTLVSDAVLAFSYDIKPFGIELASGQGRMIMPRLESHPENPNRTLPAPSGVDPDDWNPAARWGGLRYGSELDEFIADEREAGRPVKLPTREEVILAALSKGQLKNPRWRGTHADLGTLFTTEALPLDLEADPDDPFAVGYTSSNATCDQLTGEVALALNTSDPGYSELAKRSLPNDYFPHGGLIGGAELAFPNVLSNEIPGAQLTRLFTPPSNFNEFTNEWLPNAQRLFGDPSKADPTPGEPGYAYFTGTNCVGQMALYLPAPNPILPDPDNPGQFNVIDFETASLGDMVSSLQAVNFDSIVQGLDAFYPDEEILLTGWLDAPILGTPVARGSMKYNNNTKIFNLHAEVPDGTWLSDWVGADINFEITPPEYQLANLSPEGAAEKLQAIGESLATAALGDTQKIINEVAEVMPKVQAEANMNLTIPTELEPYLNTTGAANLSLFAFSPAFDPDYQLGDDSPYAVARRRGGLGIRGDFQLGYFPERGEPITIDIDEASFAVFPSNNANVFPAIAGSVLVKEITFNPNLPSFTNGEVSFATEPDNGSPYLTLAGHLEPFKFILPGTNIELLTFDALNPRGTIGGSLSILRDDSIPITNTGISLMVDPMSASMPFLGPKVGITVYGDEPKPGVFTPFSFATDSSTEWEATLCLSNPKNPNLPPTFAICDPFNPGGPCLLEFMPSAPVCGTIRGTGLSSFQLELDIPGGFTTTFMPDTPAEVSKFIGSNNPINLHLDSNGRFVIDFGALQDVGLPGALTANGHLVFGFNPDGSNPNVVTIPQNGLSFGSADLSETNAATVTIQNQGTAKANVILSTTPRNEFMPSSNGFSLEPGSSRNVDIIFSPKDTGIRNGTLTIESNDPDAPTIDLSLTGTGTSNPRYFQSRDNVSFGPTVVNGTSKSSVIVGNDGSAPMQITGVSLSNQRFTVTPTGSVVLQPGESRAYRLSYTPLTIHEDDEEDTGTLRFFTATLGSHTVNLSGSGSESRWVKLLTADIAKNDSTLNEIHMFEDARRGFVVGDKGTLLETADGGRSWIPRDITSYDLKDIAMRHMANNAAIAEYHFEEPPGAKIFHDESGNGHHGSSPSSSQTPAIGHPFGHIGSGLQFDDVNDSVDLGVFGLPDDWSISMWINPSVTTDGQCFLGKNSISGGNQFIFGFYSGGYHLRFNSSQTHTGGTKQTGWQHLVLTGDYNSTTDKTTVELYRDDILLWRHDFNGDTSNMNNGQPWSIGQEWDANPLRRSDFYGGQVDELYFFEGELSGSERDYLFRAFDGGGQRLVVAGLNGMVFQSLSNGRSWNQIADQNVLGWRSRFGLYHDYDYHAVEIAENGKIILGGSKNGNRLILMEDLHGGGNGDPQFPEDDEFDEVTFQSSAGTGANQSIFALGHRNDVFAGNSAGNFLFANTPTSTYAPLGSFDHNGVIRDLYAYSIQDFIAVADGGTIIKSSNRANPAVVSQGETSERLWAIDYDSDSSLRFRAVGENGTYLTGDLHGVNWTLVDDGLTGNMRGVSLEKNNVWAVGTNHNIQFRPSSPQTGPFLTFYPGELDFGFLLRGESKTLPLKITNSGKSDLIISQIAVEGARFSIKQSSLDAIPPGETITIYVRFQPATFDPIEPRLGELRITTNESGNDVHRVRLRGRVGSRNWQPIYLGTEGEVIDLVFTSSNTGYALVDRGSNSSRVYRTTNGGLNWTNLNLGNFGSNRLHLKGMDFSKTSTGTGMVCGSLVGSEGKFIQGITLKTSNSGNSWSTSFMPDTSDNGRIGIAHPITDVVFSEENSKNIILCTGSRNGPGDVWKTRDGGVTWSNHQRTPSDSFDGQLIGHVANELAGNDFSLILTSSGSRLYSKIWTHNWSRLFTNGQTLDRPTKVFEAQQVIRDFSFVDDPNENFLPDYGWLVGDLGLFWRWDSNGPAGADWYPAADAEVFGTTNLGQVNFHDQNSGWVVGKSKIFDSNDGGRSWDLNFDAGPDAEIIALESRSSSSAWSGGSLGRQALIWRYRSKTNPAAPILISDDLAVLDDTVPGDTTTKTVQIRNVGNTSLDLHQVSIESSDPRQRWSITSKPNSVFAGVSSNIGVRFEALPETLDIPALDPEVFLRFESDHGSTSYVDASVHRRDGSAAAGAENQPQLLQPDDRRDRSLHFDGDDDYAEVDVLNRLDGNFSVSLWCNPETLSGFEAVFGKHASNGFNYVLGGLSGDGIYVNIRNQTFVTPTGRKTGWQHLVFNYRRVGSQTEVTVFQDGAQLHQQTINAVAGSISGKPWVLGADWDSSTTINDHYSGSLDDFAIFERLLTESEIQLLANKSPVVGVHNAKLVINSDSGLGSYKVDLRAEVLPESGMVTFQSDPPGMPVQIDGVDYVTPVSFGVGENSGERAWAVGSVHEVIAPENTTVLAEGGTELHQRFVGWNSAASSTINVVASPNATSYTARYVVLDVTKPNQPPAPAQRPPAPGAPGFNISQALVGTPQGPFVKLTDGSLSLPALGNDGFTMEGELFLTPSKMFASLSTTALDFPATGSPKWMELGASNWLLDWESGSHFTLKAHPPSLTLLGLDVVPDAEFCLELNENNNLYHAVFALNEPFAPLPGIFELKPGAVSLEYQGGTAFELSMHGGIRVLDLPPVQGIPDWAIDRDFAVSFTTPNIDVSLTSLFNAAGVPLPNEFFDSGCFALDWGDIRIENNPTWQLVIDDLSLSVFDETISTVSGTAGLDGSLSLSGTLPSNLNVPLLPGASFSMRTKAGGSSSYHLDLQTGLSPSMSVHFPAMSLRSSVGGFPADGIDIPAISFDTSATFDTGKIALPSFDFDGIGLSKPSEGGLENNYVQLRRKSDGDILFDARAQIVPFLLCDLHDFSLTIENTSIEASLYGNFVVLPEAISLEFNSNSNCQFQGGNEDFTIFFGSTCAGYRNEFTGICIGDCTP